LVEPSSNTLQLGSWSFNEIKLEDMKLYSDFIKKSDCPINLWSCSFAYIWAMAQSKLRTVVWKIVDGMLVTFVYSYKESLYLFCLPFGSGSPEKVIQVLYKCLNYCYEWNKQDTSKTLVKMINDNQLEFLRKSPTFDESFRLVTFVGIERHFDIQKLVKLEGGEFSNLRNRMHKFHKNNPDAVIGIYDKNDYDELIKLGDHWKNSSGQKYAKIFDTVYYQQIVKNCFELDQIILTVKKGDKVVGMISGSELPTGQAWGSVVKFENDIPGLSETLMVEFAKELYRRNPKTMLLNVGSDLGPGGLRNYKLKFRPVLNFKRYQVYLRD